MVRRGRVIAAVAFGAAAGVGLALLLTRLFTVGMAQSYDTMLYGRSLWGIGHGEGFNPVYGMHWLGIHANLLLAPLAPLTRVFSSWSLLVGAQALAYAAVVALAIDAALRVVCGGGPGGVAAEPAATRAAPGPGLVARVLAGSWALVALAFSPLLVNPFLFDARPDLVAVPLLFTGLLRAERRGGWDRRAMLWLVAAALVREEFAAIGAATLVLSPPSTSPERWGLRERVLAACALGAWFALYWWVVRPGFAGEYAGARADEAAADLFATADPDAGRFRRAFLLAALGFGGGLALRGWRWLGPAIPGLVFVALSTKLASFALNFHYSMFAAPALAVASIAGLRTLIGPRSSHDRRRLGVLAASLLAGLLVTRVFGAHPLGERFQAENFGADESVMAFLPECHALLDRIPDDAGAAVVSMFGARFADRSEVWSMETLTRHMVEHGEVPPGVDWVAIDNNRFATLGRVLVNRHGFRLVDVAAGRLGLFERPADPDAATPLAESLARPCVRRDVEWPAVGLALCDLTRLPDGRLTGVLYRFAPRTPGAVPVAITAEVDGRGSALNVVSGLVDPATIPHDVGMQAVTAERVLAPTIRLHLQDLTGRNHPGVRVRGEQRTEPVLGVEFSLRATE